MKKSILKIVSLVVASVVTIGAIILPVHAENITSMYYTNSSTAGSYATESVHSLSSSTLSSVYGGDTGIWVFTGNSGLQASFSYKNGRTCDVQCWEKDYGGKDTFVRAYTGYFNMENGVYLINMFSDGIINKNCIESDSSVDLYMKYRVNTNVNDKSKSVPARVLRYRFWIY